MGLEEFAMIQEICQMGHKPPVVESDAAGTHDEREMSKHCAERVQIHGQVCGYCVPAIFDDLVNVKLKRSQ